MPRIGETKYGRELDRKPLHTLFVWHACLDCGKERWVVTRKGQPANLRCTHCRQVGERHPMWKGGRYRCKGYILVWLHPDNFFYPMCDKEGYVPEHRLVVAQHLGRCLLRWEIVHHINGIKDDNRYKNLSLTIRSDHIHQAEPFKKKVASLEKRVTQLEAEITLLRAELAKQEVQ